MSGMIIRPAARSSAKPLIGFYDLSGTGKTLSALFLARGFVGKSGRIVMIESESGRGEAHMDTVVGDSYVGGFEVIPIWQHEEKELPFSPRRYGAAIALAEQSKADALIIDSASHEWEGEGGVLHMAAENQEKGKKGQAVWQVPKIDHSRHFMLKLMQTPIPLVIVNMRAKYPMEEVTIDGKKEWRRSKLLEPKQSEDVLFEMFVHGHFDAAHNFHGTKYTKPELASVIPSGKPITNATGEALARWSSGTPAKTASKALTMVLELVKRATTAEELAAAVAGAVELDAEEKKLVRDAYRVHPAAAKKSEG